MNKLIIKGGKKLKGEVSDSWIEKCSLESISGCMFNFR